ncbi:acyl-CoA reductase [Nocardia sp. NPDC003979]
MTGTPLAPAFVRGRTVQDDGPEFGAGNAAFRAPDAHRLLPGLVCPGPTSMRDIHELPTTDIIDFLDEVGQRLHPDDNPYLREALGKLVGCSGLTEPVLRSTYAQLAGLFARETTLDLVENTIGIRYLDGWAEWGSARVRAFGARTVHVIAGNNPIIAAITLVRNALTRGDAVVKLPANDPYTAVALARTMAEVDPAHPLVRHLAVAYWRGGDERFESALYRPAHVEKLVAWGGFAAVRHLTRYQQPGLELVTLDPKLSATVIGPEAFTDDDALHETAALAAADVGLLNQDACFNARVVYVCTGTDTAGIEQAVRWGELLHEQIQALPPAVSTAGTRFDPGLRRDIAALRTSPAFFRVFGGTNDEGAVLVSLSDEPVDFHASLSGRVANVVPIDHPERALDAMNAYTQTVGVWPESLKHTLRDLAPHAGAQRLVSLGFATHFRSDTPQDGIEPMRRLVKWVVDETYDPHRIHPFAQLAPAVEAVPR